MAPVHAVAGVESESHAEVAGAIAAVSYMAEESFVVVAVAQAHHSQVILQAENRGFNKGQ